MSIRNKYWFSKVIYCAGWTFISFSGLGPLLEMYERATFSMLVGILLLLVADGFFIRGKK